MLYLKHGSYYSKWTYLEIFFFQVNSMLNVEPELTKSSDQESQALPTEPTGHSLRVSILFFSSI